MGYVDDFKNKRITVLGLGLLGRGVGDIEFLAGCGAKVLVTDKKTETELAESVAKLKQYRNVTFHLGGHKKEDFAKCAIATGAKIVGVTGTRGKTTVAYMIYHCLKNGLKTALLGGNVRGVSTLAMLTDVKKGDIAVLELDSWQLQGFGDLKISPHIAVFTNLMPDHQNYYKDMDAYFSDKANIFRYQHQGDALMVGRSVSERVEAGRAPCAPPPPPPPSSPWES